MARLTFVAFAFGYLLFATLASAQTLWHDLGVGMTQAEVERLHPTLAAQVVPGCTARIEPTYQSGRLISVMITAPLEPFETFHDWRLLAACSVRVEAALNGRYGAPTAQRGPQPNEIDVRHLTGWNRSDVYITFANIVDGGRRSRWSINYERRR